VLLHGLASSARIWDFVAPLLRPHGRVVALDQRGHGATGKPDTGYDTPTFVADLAGALQVLGLTRPVVVGHSWGAGVALAYAAAGPACAGAVLVDGGVADMQARPDATWEETARRLAPPDLSALRMDDLVAYMGSGPLAALDEPFRRAFFGSLMVEQPDGTVRPRLTRARHLAILRSIWDTRPAALLAAVHCPLLVVLADPPGTPAPDPFQLAKTAGLAPFAAHPGVVIRRMADTIHDAPLQRPAALAALITGWL
jgi:pimeloyl-ACP methyl ester carboxylesterase